MNISRNLKDNRYLRGIYCIWNRDFGGLKRSRFGFISNYVILTPPHIW